jgi:cytosine/adenosine deaminase-related metal-dependent hydrolase
MMSLAACVNKEARRDPQIMNPFPVFEMATRTAAEAIGWADRIGSLEIGMAAELAIFDMSGPGCWPDPLRTQCRISFTAGPRRIPARCSLMAASSWKMEWCPELI